MTSSLSATLAAALLHADADSTAAAWFEYALRGIFFALNLLFDALMWGLFTRALTLAASTVHVSVLNTSTNFLVAAAAGVAVFGERLPAGWFLGAAMLIAGCLLIGQREGGQDGQKTEGYDALDGTEDLGEMDRISPRVGTGSPRAARDSTESAWSGGSYRDSEDGEEHKETTTVRIQRVDDDPGFASHS